MPTLAETDGRDDEVDIALQTKHGPPLRVDRPADP
jgi:hypothetical protein